MLVKTLTVGFLQTNCYVVTDEDTLECAVIDPGGESGTILGYLEQHGLRCRAILITHGHYDHCLALEAVKEATGAPAYMSLIDAETDFMEQEWNLEPPEDMNYVEDGDVIEAGPLSFTVIACPGHTPGGLTYQIQDCLFTGDTLFRLTCGRYDFPESSALDLSRSLDRLRSLEGDYEVYPGHGDASSLEFERRFNPTLLSPYSL